MKTLTSTKLGSLLLTLAAAGLALGATGCTVSAEVTGPAVDTVSIDPDAAMTLTPGSGVGVYVSYASGGHWTISTTCDVATRSYCYFDLNVRADPGVTVDNVEGHDLEAADTLSLEVNGSITLKTETTRGTDGVSFDTPPGATIELDAMLEGDSAERFVFVVQDGKLLHGVPGNPVDFIPSAR
jgi:hypothetical protein